MLYGNCLIYAFWSWYKYGGYFIVRKSRVSRIIPHFLWKMKESSPMKHFTPIQHKSGLYKFIHKFWFKGYIKIGDKDLPNNK